MHMSWILLPCPQADPRYSDRKCLSESPPCHSVTITLAFSFTIRIPSQKSERSIFLSFVMLSWCRKELLLPCMSCEMDPSYKSPPPPRHIFYCLAICRKECFPPVCLVTGAPVLRPPPPPQRIHFARCINAIPRLCGCPLLTLVTLCSSCEEQYSVT